jgi:hypothetical protein
MLDKGPKQMNLKEQRRPFERIPNSEQQEEKRVEDQQKAACTETETGRNAVVFKR